MLKESSCKSIELIRVINENTIDSPPAVGTASKCELLSLGISTKFNLYEIFEKKINIKKLIMEYIIV